MSNWQFTDQYGTAYPALADNSILGLLVFDITGASPVNGTSFTGTLDLTASGPALSLLASLTGMSSIPFTGTVTTTNNVLTVGLTSVDTAALTAALASIVPLVGNKIQQVTININSVVEASLAADDFPAVDTMGLSITIAIGTGTGTLQAVVPMSGGFFALEATFQNVGIGLSDLDFLVPGTNNFTNCFPTTQLQPYYDNQPSLALLSLSLDLYVTTGPFSITVSSVGVSLGITNIPLYNKALYLDPLAVWVQVSNIHSPTPVFAWGLEGNFVLCNYNRPGDTANPDFTFDLQMGFPTDTQPNFSVSGNFDNPNQQPVSQIVSDLLGQQTSLGFADTITLEKFDFYADADVKAGTINDFAFEIGMSGQFGIFEKLTVESFSISVAYSS